MWVRHNFKKPKHKLIWGIVFMLGFIPIWFEDYIKDFTDYMPYYVGFMITWLLFGSAILTLLSNMKETIMKSKKED